MVRSSLLESFASQYYVRFLTANITLRTDVLHPVFSQSFIRCASPYIPFVYLPHLISVPQLCRRYRWHICLRVLKPL